MLNKVTIKKKKCKCGAIAIIILIAICAGCGFSRDIELTNAWSGWAPPSFVSASDPSTKIVEKDFLSYLNLHIGNSLIMRVYPLAYQILDADPTAVQIIVIYGSCLVYAWAVLFLAKALMPLAPTAVFVGAVALAILTSTVDGDLARFGQGNFSLGQYYGFAVALQMIVAALAFRDEILKCGIGLALLLWVHPMIAAITGFVAGVVLFLPRPELKLWPKYLFLLCLVISSAAIYLVVMKEGISARAKMPFVEWIDWVRFFNYHWFPFELGVFTLENSRRIAPLLAILLLAFAGLQTKKLSSVIMLKWSAAMLVCIFLVVVGLLNSIAPKSMILTIMSLHRASALILLLALPFACLSLYHALKSDWPSKILAVVILASPFIGSWGFPIMPALALFFLKQPHKLLSSDMFFKVIWSFGILVAGLAIGNVLWLTLRHATAFFSPSLFGPQTAWFLGVLYGIISLAAKSLPLSWSYFQKGPPAILGATFVILITLKIQDNWKRHPEIEDKNMAKDYLEVQKWARANTPAGSLFMTDPTHCYGWKDYSARPSWGNYRDWLHSSIAYHADTNLFQEGLSRCKILEVDPSFYLNLSKKENIISPSGKYYAQLYHNLKSAYYSLDDEKLKFLSEKYKINYAVFEKQKSQKIKQKPVYESKYYKVFKLHNNY